MEVICPDCGNIEERDEEHRHCAARLSVFGEIMPLGCDGIMRPFEGLTAGQLEAIGKRHAASSQGLWEVRENIPYSIGGKVIFVGRFENNRTLFRTCSPIQNADVEFVAHAHRDIPLLLLEIKRMRAAVAEHHEEKADDRCWLDDDKLYAAFGLPAPDRRVGDKTEMLVNCSRFITARCEGGGWASYIELEGRLAGLIEALAPFREELRDCDCGTEEYPASERPCRYCKLKAAFAEAEKGATP